jgi:Flp pilus assembly protein CpaB
LIASPILIIAIVAALALSGTVAVTTVSITLLQQQAQAAKSPRVSVLVPLKTLQDGSVIE